MADLTSILIQYGAPILKDLIEKQIGGIGGRMAGSVIDSLAKDLGTAATPEAVANEIERSPEKAQPIIDKHEEDAARIVESMSTAMISYHGVLQTDAKSEGILSRLWRPLFAIVYTIGFAMQVTTICWLMWTRQWGTLNELGDVVGFLTFLDVAGAAVLGVQIFQQGKTDREGK